MFPLLVTVTGLPHTNKRKSLRKAFDVWPTTETDTFAQHELVATWSTKSQSAIILNVKENASFTYGLYSGIKYEQQSVTLTGSPADESIFKDQRCIEYFTEVIQSFQYAAVKTNLEKDLKEISDLNSSDIMNAAASASVETSGQATQSFTQHGTSNTANNVEKEKKEKRVKEFHHMLVHGIGLLNIWDTFSNNRTVRPILESFGRCFTRSMLWLFLDFDRDSVDQLHLPPAGTESDPKALKFQSRIEYLLRQCHLCKHSTYKKKDRYVCTIFATYTPDKNMDASHTKLKLELLQNACQDAAKQVGVDNLIDFFNIQLVPKDSEKTAKPLQVRLRRAFSQIESKHVPLSWLFLRGTLNFHPNFYIKYSKLKEIADDCGVPAEHPSAEYGLQAFCDFFGSYGSILDVRKCHENSEYIIIKPHEFLSYCDHLLKRSKEQQLHADGFIQAQENEIVLFEILASVGMAVYTPVTGADYRYFVPSVRSGERKLTIDSGSVQFVVNMASPNIHQNVEIIKELQNTLPHSKLHPSKWTNGAFITTIENEFHMLLSF